MAQVTYTKENDKWYADFDNRKKTLWKERWISPIDMPEPTPSVTKGEIINIDMNGDGTTEQYRVIKVLEGGVVEVLAMTDATSIAFSNDGTNTYEGKTLDIYCNTNWYNTLSDNVKSAIVDKTFRQDRWFTNTAGNPIYQGKNSGGTYQVSLANASFGNEITRHIYVLGIQDIIDYLDVTSTMTQEDTTLTTNNVWTMFWNSTTTHTGNLWMRSAYAVNIFQALYLIGSSANMLSTNVSGSYAVRPAFQIDLTKIEWTPTTK